MALTTLNLPKMTVNSSVLGHTKSLRQCHAVYCIMSNSKAGWQGNSVLQQFKHHRKAVQASWILLASSNDNNNSLVDGGVEELPLRPGQQVLETSIITKFKPEWIVNFSGHVETYSGWVDLVISRTIAQQATTLGRIVGIGGTLTFNDVAGKGNGKEEQSTIKLTSTDHGIKLGLQVVGLGYTGYLVKWPTQPNDRPKVCGVVQSTTERMSGEIQVTGAVGMKLEALDFMVWDPSQRGILPIETWRITLAPRGGRILHRHNHIGFYQFFSDGVEFEIPHGLLVPTSEGGYQLTTKVLLKKGEIIHIPQSTEYAIWNRTDDEVFGSYTHCFT